MSAGLNYKNYTAQSLKNSVIVCKSNLKMERQLSKKFVFL
ncbi:17531_t:CDS:2 [Dentiscutata erythropus]|uniref:17531_t:CDS:1 n=1 Tax=Dentiscutata erythropus TaxID=1348616 RepID=A0A9N9DQF0_9GLOM|nr:17531_t:CDS:2 [Dentiscutata erythropus]